MPRPLSVLPVVGNSIIGGGETHVLWLLDALRRLGVEIPAVVCPRPGPLTEVLAAYGFPVTCIDMGNWEAPALVPESIGPLASLFSELQPDVVHCHLQPALRHAMQAAPLAGIDQLIYTVHGLETIPARDLDSRVRLVAIAVAGAVAANLRAAELAADIEVVHNGISRGYFSSQPLEAAELRRELVGDRRPVLGAVARLSWEKGTDQFLWALPTVLQRYPDAVAVVAGDGPEADVLGEQVRWAGLEDHVRFLGPRRDVPLLYQAFDVFVLPSRSEGCPLALLEAMAAGTPSVAAAVGGVAEVVRDGLDGVVVPPEDPERIAVGILSLLDDDAFRRRAARAARHRVASEFTADRMAEKTLSVYRRVAARQKDAAGVGGGTNVG